MTPNDMADVVRIYAGDNVTSPSFATDANLLVPMNRGLARVAAKMLLHNPNYFDKASSALSLSSRAMTIPTDCRRIKALKRTDQTDDGEDVMLLTDESQAPTFRGRDDVFFVQGKSIICCGDGPSGATYKIVYQRTLTAVDDMSDTDEYELAYTASGTIPDDLQDLACAHAARLLMIQLGRDITAITRIITELENEAAWTVGRQMTEGEQVAQISGDVW
jgi:hypothetical protein